MIRYAIISDIHGNLSALEAVIEDIKKQDIDRIICLGDIIGKGSHGHECVKLVREFCDATVRAFTYNITKANNSINILLFYIFNYCFKCR